MLTVDRSLSLSIDSGKPLPQVPELQALYDWGTTPRHGQTMMIVGRSGSQKSGFALWWMDRMDIDCLYFSADMSPFTASSRVASSRWGISTEELEETKKKNPAQFELIMAEAAKAKFTFNFGSPIRLSTIEAQLDAYVQAFDRYPTAMIYDNLMDFEGAEAEYGAQMEVMQLMTELSRETGSATVVIHHASDKSWDAKTDPWNPPGRSEVKNGMSEKPELTLAVSLNAYTMDFHIATIKQRMGRQDPTGRTFVTLRAEPEKTRFHAKKER
jgi:hypothetical protein